MGYSRIKEGNINSKGVYLQASNKAEGRSLGGARLLGTRRGILEGKQLPRAECLIVDLSGGFNEVLEVGPEKEVPEVDELAMVLVFDVDNTPTVLPAADRLAINNYITLRADNGERNDAPDPFVEFHLLGVGFVSVEGV